VSVMSKQNAPVVIVEDDVDDIGILIDIFKDLGITNKIISFQNSEEAFNFLKTTPEQPFIIISDVNITPQNGIEFKRRIDNDAELRRKSIPFVFYSTSVNQKAVNEAYTKMTVQGFFKKSNSYDSVKADIKLVFDYWKLCKHPNA
jgi:two-component SAPR family response regulator